jgi:hypothetical protein
VLNTPTCVLVGRWVSISKEPFGEKATGKAGEEKFHI